MKIQSFPAYLRSRFSRFIFLLALTGMVETAAAANLVVSNVTDSATGSLRDCIAKATAGSTITFATNLSGQVILLNSSLVLNSNMTIDASMLAKRIQINGQALNRILLVNGVTATLNALVLTNGNAGSGDGGGIENNGTLTVSNSVIVKNNGTFGGGIENNGTLTVNNSTIVNNHGTYGGGIDSGGPLTLNSSTIVSNSAGFFGGGIRNAAVLTMKNTTVANNTCQDGGGIFNFGGISTYGTLIVNNSTIVNNWSTGGSSYTAGGIQNEGVLVLTNTIVCGNLYANSGSAADIDNSVAFGYLKGPGNVLSQDALLAPLGNYGGLTQTLLPLPGSPAIDAGSDTVTSFLSTDQRGLARKTGLHVDSGAVESGIIFSVPEVMVAVTNVAFTNVTVLGTINPAGATTGYYFQIGLTTNYSLTSPVNPLAAGVTNVLVSWTWTGLKNGTTYHVRVVATNTLGTGFGDDLAFTTFGGTNMVLNNLDDGSAGSLRAVVGRSNPYDTILFTNTLSGATILLTNGEIYVGESLTIDGSALAAGVLLNGNHVSRVFRANAPGTVVVLNALTITNAYSGDNKVGGGILAQGNTLIVNKCIFANNNAFASGGGISMRSGTLTINNSTFTNNYGNSGGAIAFAGGTATVNNSAFIKNSCSDYGGAIDMGTVFTMNNCTLVNNSSAYLGGGIAIGSGTLTVNHCTLVNNTNGGIWENAGGVMLNLTNSIVCSNSAGNLTLKSGGYHFGSTNLIDVDPRLAPLGNYGGPTLTMPPLISSPAFDAGDDSATDFLATDQRGFARKMGAHVDIGAVELQTPFPVVTTTNDGGAGSLRQIVSAVDVGAVITFTNSLSGKVIALTSGQIVLGNYVTIDASALANGIQLNGSHNSRIFQISSGATAVLNALTLTNGYSGASAGGAIDNEGTLTLNRCLVISNVIAAFGGGGAVNNGTLTVNASSFVGNFSTNLFASGGGIQNQGTLILNQSTFTGNAANGGGAIFANTGSFLTVNQCTIVSNTAYCCGGGISLYTTSGNQTLVNSIVAGNVNQDLYLAFSGLTTSSNNLTGVNPLLAPLGYYGGPTPTFPPLPGSPAVDKGSDAVAGASATDQRGLPRISGDHADIGAAELQLITASNPARVTSTAWTGSAGKSPFRFGFTNQTGASFRVFASTNVALPLSAWTLLGFVSESPANSGQFQFTDSQATNNPRRFYRLRSP